MSGYSLVNNRHIPLPYCLNVGSGNGKPMLPRGAANGTFFKKKAEPLPPPNQNFADFIGVKGTLLP